MWTLMLEADVTPAQGTWQGCRGVFPRGGEAGGNRTELVRACGGEAHMCETANITADGVVLCVWWHPVAPGCIQKFLMSYLTRSINV